jgi:crotonobetainyl-CoA:carnitine CoA-transferase CaiB-like acyl-CoA transferase
MLSSVMNGPLPLDGLRVLELGHIIAGPSAGLLLADLGADVIKVEKPGEGDQTRGMPAGNGANFHFLNRNKRSITIDLKGSPEGRALFLRLARGSDIVIDNFAYGAVEGLGLGYDVLERENPRIIYMALKGFLPGPYEARPFLDELAQMSAGLAFMTGPRGQPMRAGASIVDVGAAAYGVIAVLAALQQRAQTGRGQKITSGLYETTVFWVGQWLANYGATGEPSVPMPEIRQGTRMGWGIYQLFTAADGERVFVGITSNAHWERFCTEFGLADLLADERLNDNSKRVAARAWLPARIAEEMLKYPSAALAERLERAAKLRESLSLRPMFSVAGTDTFMRKNTNRSVGERLDELPGWAERYQKLGLDWVDVGVMAAFGCNYEGDVDPKHVVTVLQRTEQKANACGSRLGGIGLADTMGWANPLQIKRLVGAVRDRWPSTPIKLHLHDTRALGVANIVAALEVGVDCFDSAVAGMGGCPFAAHKGAAGNVTTEDVVFLCQEMGVETGIDLDKMIEAGQLAERVVGHPLPGKLKSGGNLETYRARAKGATRA